MTDPYRYYMIDDDVIPCPRTARYTCTIRAAVIIMPHGAAAFGHQILWCHDAMIAYRERARALGISRTLGSKTIVEIRPVSELTVTQYHMIRKPDPWTKKTYLPSPLN